MNQQHTQKTIILGRLLWKYFVLLDSVFAKSSARLVSEDGVGGSPTLHEVDQIHPGTIQNL